MTYLLTTPTILVDPPVISELRYVLMNANFSQDEETGELFLHSNQDTPSFPLCTDVLYRWKAVVDSAGVAQPELQPIETPDRYRAHVVHENNIYLILPRDVIPDETGNGGQRFVFHTLPITRPL